MTFYVGLFGGRVIEVARYGAMPPGMANKIIHATIEVAGLRIKCMDSAIPHAFTFTPSSSTYVECDSVAEVDRLYAGLAEGGTALMPLNEYPFARRFGWVNDRFGVSWQLIHGVSVGG